MRFCWAVLTCSVLSAIASDRFARLGALVTTLPLCTSVVVVTKWSLPSSTRINHGPTAARRKPGGLEVGRL